MFENKPNSKVEKLLYSKKDAAFALSLSVRAIEYMLADKRLSFRRFGNRVLIPAADIRRISRMDDLQGARPR